MLWRDRRAGAQSAPAAELGRRRDSGGGEPQRNQAAGRPAKDPIESTYPQLPVKLDNLRLTPANLRPTARGSSLLVRGTSKPARDQVFMDLRKLKTLIELVESS